MREIQSILNEVDEEIVFLVFSSSIHYPGRYFFFVVI